jgi:hypothetical protein
MTHLLSYVNSVLCCSHYKIHRHVAAPFQDLTEEASGHPFGREAV